MDDGRDEMIDRAARALGAIPPVRTGAVARVLMAVRANQARPASPWRRFTRRIDAMSVSARGAALLVAASLVAGFFVRGSVGEDRLLPAAVPVVGPTLQPAANGAAEQRLMPVAVAFEAANATSVSVVGDFNGWDPRATPMARVGDSGPWSATVFAKPGRHTYAFLIDGTTLVADPRAPRARSADFEGDASVMMVRTP